MTSSYRYVGLLDTESVEISNYDAIKPLRDGGGGFYLTRSGAWVDIFRAKYGDCSPLNRPHVTGSSSSASTPHHPH